MGSWSTHRRLASVPGRLPGPRCQGARPRAGLGAPYPGLDIGESGFLWAGVTWKLRDHKVWTLCGLGFRAASWRLRLAPKTVLVPRALLPIPLQAGPRAEVSEGGAFFLLILLGPYSLSRRFTSVGRQQRTRQNATNYMPDKG